MASGFQVQMRLDIKELVGELKELKKKAKKAIRTGVTKGGRRLAQGIKARLKAEAKETGLLARSIGSRVVTYPSGAVVAIAGVRKGFRQTVKIKGGRVYRFIRGRLVRIRRPRPEFLQMIRNPEKYLHLIELGFTQKSGRHVPGKFPIRRTMDAMKAELEQVIITEFQAAMGGK